MRLLILAVVTLAVVVVELVWHMHDLTIRVNRAGDKLAVLECSHVWNDEARTITHSTYREYLVCLRTGER